MYFRAVDAAFPTRLFSLRDANALVGTLQAHFEHARELRDKLAALQADLVKAGHPMDRPEVQVDPAAPPEVQRLQRNALAILDDLRSILREVSELGVEVKAADGLVDFRSKLRGRTVYLCWRYGERSIDSYHELDTGFSGRRPLPDDAEFIGDLLH
jgi:hypothetical protein